MSFDAENIMMIQEELNDAVRDLAEYIDDGDKRAERDCRKRIKGLAIDLKIAKGADPSIDKRPANEGIHS